MSEGLQFENVRSIGEMALIEDIGAGDITSNAIFDGSEQSGAVIIAKDRGVFCGGPLVSYVFQVVDPAIVATQLVAEGGAVSAGDEVMTVLGPVRGILAGERTALNFLQRASGIASRTAKVTSMLKGTPIRVLDTRKTLPGHRLIDKYAVKTGGGFNHRMGLFDMVMIKDNHIRAAGGIAAAVARVREEYGTRYRIEVETTSLDEVREAASAGADIIMLDNMGRDSIVEAIGIIEGRAKIEVSGNIDEYRIHDLVDLRIDFISMGSLTHSARAFDFSMKFR